MPTRLLNGILCIVAAFGVIAQFAMTGTGPADPAEPDPGVLVSLIRFFSFFTILSNLLVVISSVPPALGREPGYVQRVLRLSALVGIIITGVVHWFLLRPDADLSGFTAVVDAITHVVVPILTVLVWLTVGPRGLISRAVVLGSFLYPVLYAGWTLAHGALTDWYPYPFIDVPTVGYPQALTMAAIILGSFALLAVLAWLLDLALLRLLRTRQEPRCESSI